MIINFQGIANLLGSVLIFLAIAMVVPTMYAFITVTKGSAEFLFVAAVMIVTGLAIRRITRSKSLRMTLKDMFFFTSSVWTTMILTAALPFKFTMGIDYVTACFEATSAVSTTGITVLHDIDNLPPSILLWRSILQYFGGIGFIAMAIAVLPNLNNLGGMKLFKTESSEQGSEKVSPKSKTIALGILILYITITIITFLAYWILGMNTFDAFNHALTSVATGGMSTHAASMDYFSAEIQWFAVGVMFICSLPFPLLILSIKNDIRQIFRDSQVKGFCRIIIISIILVMASLIVQENMPFMEALRFSVFNVVDVLSSTGYSMGDFSNINPFITLLFFVILPIGGCSGSTSGGLKIFRFQILLNLFRKQINQLHHPSAIFPQQYNGQNINETIMRSIAAFFFAYACCLILSSLILSLTGTEMLDALTLSFNCLSNIGVGVGEHFGPQGDFTLLTSFQKIILIFDMVMGRLEVLTIILCFLPSFWRV